MKQIKNKALYITGLIIAFLLITGGALSLVMGALFDRTNFIYLGLILLGIGFVFCFTIFIVLIVLIYKYTKAKGE